MLCVVLRVVCCVSLGTQCQTPGCHLECRLSGDGYAHRFSCTSCKFSNGHSHDWKCTRRAAAHPVLDDIMIATGFPTHTEQPAPLFYSMPLCWCNRSGIACACSVYGMCSEVGINEVLLKPRTTCPDCHSRLCSTLLSAPIR